MINRFGEQIVLGIRFDFETETSFEERDKQYKKKTKRQKYI